MARDFTKNLSNYVTLGVNAIGPLINGASQVSFSYWVKFDTFTTSAAGDGMFSVRLSNLNSRNAYTSSAKLVAGGRSQAADSFRLVTGTSTLSTAVWYHVGIMYNYAVDNIIIYLNGAVDANAIISTWGSPTYVHSDSLYPDFIGSSSTIGFPTNAAQQLDGQMAELAVWKTQLNANDFASLTKGFTPNQIRPQSLVAYLPMTGSGTNIQEIVKANNGTIIGSIPAADHPRIYS